MLQPETLPLSLRDLLQAFRPCFTAPTFRTFTLLLTGLVCRTGAATVCAMLTGAGLAGIRHHSRAHWFFTHARWQADALGLALTKLVITRILPPDAPVELAIDDTLFRRSGRKIHATAWHHDATSPTRRRRATAWGHNWIIAGILIHPPWRSRPLCLPVLARLWTPGGDHKATLARHLTELIATTCPDRPIHLAADALYATRHWRGTGQHNPNTTTSTSTITLTFRLRANAALTEIHTPEPGKPTTGRPGSGLPGRPKLRGPRIGTPQTLANREHWQPRTLTRYGRTEPTHLIDYHCLWTGPLLSRPVRVILITDHPDQQRRNGRSYDLALITTDLTTTAETIITRYAARWAIEVTFHDTKHLTGTGQARNRTPRAVQRTVPFALLTHSLVICWYTLTTNQPGDITHRRTTAPWYTTKTEPSYHDMHTTLRHTLIAARFKPPTPRPATTQEILAVHQAWANAAA